MERVEEHDSELQQAVRAAIADARAERERLERQSDEIAPRNEDEKSRD
jgi:hypothetical protein